MNRKTLSAVLFLVSFIASYAVLCCILTGWKMALEATALDYVLVSIRYMAPFKTVVSLAAALAVGSLPRLVSGRA